MHLIEVLPDYYDDNETMQELQKILSQDSDNLEESLAATLKEIYWISATGKEYLESSQMKESRIVTEEKKFQQKRRELQPRS